MRYVKIIAAAIALTATAANAEYMIKIPLERDNGGFLPVGSIVFKSEPAPTPISSTNEEKCYAAESATRLMLQNKWNTSVESYGWVELNRRGQVYYTCELKITVPAAISSACIGNYESVEQLRIDVVALTAVNTAINYSYYGQCN